jgi:arylsulfatase A-like enzyme
MRSMRSRRLYPSRGLATIPVLVLGLVAGLACTPEEEHVALPRGVVLIVLDTLRADGLSTYGNARATSPHIDRLASQGVIFEQAISHAAWTLPGFVGLFSGRYPSKHVYSERRLSGSLLETMQQAGFETAAFTEGAYVSSAFGMDRGFDHFSEHPAKIHLGAALARNEEAGGIEQTFDAAIDWLDEPRSGPFFLLVHSYEPHLPYRRDHFARELAPGRLGATYGVADAGAVMSGELEAGETERQYVRALYDGGVRAADEQVGRLLEALDSRGLARKTIVAITSDHGEDLGERDPRWLGLHEHSLFDELLRVPLIVHDPRQRPATRRVATQVRLVDVLPTLLELAGIERPAGLDGRSLVPLMRGEAERERPAFASLTVGEQQIAALRTSELKLIWTRPRQRGARGSPALFRIGVDPGERHDVARSRPEEVRALTALLKAQQRVIASAGRLDFTRDEHVDPGVRAQLRALGYIDDTGKAEDGTATEN